MPNSEMRERAKKVIAFPAEPCSHGMVGDEDICDSCKYIWERSLIDKVADFATLERVEAIEECAKIADKLACKPWGAHDLTGMRQRATAQLLAQELRSKLAAPSVEQKGETKC